MESVDFYDKYLDPPDDPPYADCDRCGHSIDTDDMVEVGRRWLCEDCAALEEGDD